MPNKMINHHPHQHGQQHGHTGLQTQNNKQLQTKQQNNANTFSNSNDNINIKSSNNNNNISSTGHQDAQQPSSILNVAEMILHGVADNEILDIWLRSIACQEFAVNFINAGYDMPTISRITPQDLTAIGITEPTKRLKILSEIKRLNLQDGIPTFKPASLSHWLSLLRLDSHYHKSLCDQQIDTIEKTCQLTWEDLEEMGITKLGHQKRLLLAIERMKDIDSRETKLMSKPMSEPIYDTNPSQILLVASAENHSINGPIINKQSSTSELSSTGSGSMHSLYSSSSVQYQPTYATLPVVQQQQQQQHDHYQSTQQQMPKQAIYSQSPSKMLPPQHLSQQQLPNGLQFNRQQQTQPIQNSHYQSIQPHFISPIYDTNNLNGRTATVNRQSLGQLPFSALANLPKHQQQLLQQSSIYATLSRQPQRAKQPPPPVPVRTNSLKSSSLVDEDANNHSSLQSLTNTQTNSTSNLFRSGTRVSNRNQFNSQTLLSKNKSFSGGAYMDAARARFLNRNNQQQPLNSLPQMMQQSMKNHQEGVNNNQTTTQNLIYGNSNTTVLRRDSNLTNERSKFDTDNMSLYSRQSLQATISNNQAGSFNMMPPDLPMAPLVLQQFNQSNPIQPATMPKAFGPDTINRRPNKDDYDRYSDTNSTKSLILPTSNATNSPINSHGQATSLSRDSDSSQTLYNSASSGSNDHNFDAFSQSRQSTVSNSTLNDVNLILDQQVVQNQHHARPTNHDQQTRLLAKTSASTSGRYECNATTGKDDDFPPPPSPLSLTEFDDHNPSSNSCDSNFTDISQGLMTFRVGT